MTDLLPLLQQFHREKLAMLLRHEAGARFITQYDVNNTYQYIINRDAAQLSWVAKAVAELGGSVSDDTDPTRTPPGKGADAAPSIIDEDRHDAQAFVDRWKPRVDRMTNARHAKTLNLILGEVLEQKRFFEQALAGRTDLLGRRSEQLEPSRGEVLPTRGIE